MRSEHQAALTLLTILHSAVVAPQTPAEPRSVAQALAATTNGGREFHGDKIILTETLPCFAAGGNCAGTEEGVPGLDLAALHGLLPGAVRVESRERGGAVGVIEAHACRTTTRCVLVGFALSPTRPPADTSLTLIMATVQVLEVGERRALIEDFTIELRRGGDGWVVTSFYRSRVS